MTFRTIKRLAVRPVSTAVASLGWVTPGAATEGVAPLFFPEKNWRPFL